MKYSLLILVMLVNANQLLAQPTTDTLTQKELENIVVTGQYKPQSAKNSVYQVRTITADRIQRQAAVNLQTVLNNELNIRFTQDVATGGAGITMMGLKGQNVKILLDGLPMTGRQGTSNEININQIDINTIERIEIVEGPMSVVYGADALAGVINIITKKAATANISVTARLLEESIGNAYGFQQGIHNQSVSLSYRKKYWELGGGFTHNYFGGWKDTLTGRELAWHKKDQLLAHAFLAYYKNNFNIRYRLDGIDEVITNPGNYIFFQPASGEWLAQDQEYLTSRLMHQLQSSYFVNSKLNFQLQSTFSDYRRQVFSTTLSQQTGKVALDMATGRQALIHFKGFTLRSFVNYSVSKLLSLQSGVDINLDRGNGERLTTGNNKVDDYAFFITSELTPSKKVNIRPGIRVIKNTVYNAPPVVPSINTKITLSKSLDLRLAYASGFRSPSLRELYFNFFDANHQIFGNKDLKAETSNSYTGSLTWSPITKAKKIYTIALSGFYNSVKNLIDYAVSASDPNVFILTNVDNSKTAGANINLQTKYKSLLFSVGGAYTGFYNDYAANDDALPQLQWSPEVNSTVGYTFPKVGIDINLFYKYTGKRPFYAINNNQQLVLTEQAAYHMADVTINKKAGHNFLFTGGIRNLFNVNSITSNYATGGVHTNNGVRNIATGRSFFAGITFNWNKK
jgi:outer membrane receptor for ferrienterochelin and colicins